MTRPRSTGCVGNVCCEGQRLRFRRRKTALSCLARYRRRGRRRACLPSRAKSPLHTPGRAVVTRPAAVVLFGRCGAEISHRKRLLRPRRCAAVHPFRGARKRRARWAHAPLRAVLTCSGRKELASSRSRPRPNSCPKSARTARSDFALNLVFRGWARVPGRAAIDPVHLGAGGAVPPGSAWLGYGRSLYAKRALGADELFRGGSAVAACRAALDAVDDGRRRTGATSGAGDHLGRRRAVLEVSHSDTQIKGGRSTTRVPPYSRS